MVRWIVTITNEGAALLASVIAAQGTLNITEARVSDHNYYGQEATLTEGTFADVYQTVPASATVINSTTIKVKAMFSAAGLPIAREMATVGIIANDGNSDILLAVLTTADEPDTIEPGIGVDQGSVTFNINLTVSSTSDITVVGTTAAVLYDTDIVDNLTTADATKVLSANMGRVLNENIEAIVDVYGAKNLNVYPYYETTKAENGLTFTDNGDGTVTVSGTAEATTIFYCHHRDATYANGLKIANGNYKFSGAINSNISANLAIRAKISGAYELLGSDYGAGLSFTIDGDYYSNDNAQLEIALVVDSGTVISTPIIFKPMIRDARIVDPAYAPYAKTNRELTEGIRNVNDLVVLFKLAEASLTLNVSNPSGLRQPIVIFGAAQTGRNQLFGIITLNTDGTINTANGNLTATISDGVITVTVDNPYAVCLILHSKEISVS